MIRCESFSYCHLHSLDNFCYTLDPLYQLFTTNRSTIEWLRNKHGTFIHSYDPINDQENAERQPEFQDESSVDEVFNEQVPSELAANFQTTENHGPSVTTMYNLMIIA